MRSEVTCPRFYLQQWEFIPPNVEPGHVTRPSVHQPSMTLLLTEKRFTKKHWFKWSYFTWCLGEPMRSYDHVHSLSGEPGSKRALLKVHPGIKSTVITLGELGAGQQNAREQNAHSLPSELKTQLSKIPSQIAFIPVWLTLPFTTLEDSHGENLYFNFFRSKRKKVLGVSFLIKDPITSPPPTILSFREIAL